MYQISKKIMSYLLGILSLARLSQNDEPKHEQQDLVYCPDCGYPLTHEMHKKVCLGKV